MVCIFLTEFLFVVIQIRKYDPFVVVEADGDVLSGSKGFNDVAG